jgi:RNA polymerase sigma factor (sigma-70 family)
MLAESQPEISQLVLDDAHLWQNLRKNNNLAFSILYKKYTPKLYNYGMHQFHDHDQVMDCLQELFTSIWSKRAELSAVQSVGAYLFKSFRRLMIKRINWRKKFLLSMDRQHERAFDVMVSIDRVIENGENEREQHKKLLRSLKGLTLRQREAIFLKFYNDLAYSDIAAIMEMQVDSVYNLISKAIDSLRRTLK